MTYILGHKPYEFGLVPDNEGYVTFKELLWAVNEEPGWSQIRQSNINEVLLGDDRDLFQHEGNRIRSLERRWHFDFDRPALSLPKILYIGIRRRAHPAALENGLREIKGSYHVLSPDRKMAERIGKRRDQKPVLLEIMARTASKEAGIFYPFGGFFLTPEIKAGHIAGPPVPKHLIKAGEEKPSIEHESVPDFKAGTFVLDLTRETGKPGKTGGRKKKGWKEEARRHRKSKRL